MHPLSLVTVVVVASKVLGAPVPLLNPAPEAAPWLVPSVPDIAT